MTRNFTKKAIVSLIISSSSLLLSTIAYSSSPDESSNLSEIEFVSGTAADLVFEQNNDGIFHSNEENLINDQSFLIPKTGISEQPTTNINKLIADDSSFSDNQEQVQSWEFKIQPYYTIPWKVYGEATVDGITVDLDIGLGDLLDTLQAYANTRFEAWNGNWGIIVDASYWSFRGVNDFQKELNLNNKIRERIKDDIEFFTEQEIEKVEQLLEKEQEFFQAVEDEENTLVRQLIQQEINDFREQLIGEINNISGDGFNSSDRRDLDISEQLSAQQLEVSDGLKNGLNIAQELKSLHDRLLSQTFTLNTNDFDLSELNTEKTKLETIKQTLQEIENKAELVDITLPDISSKLDSRGLEVSDRLQDALNIAQELKDLQSKLLTQTLTLDTQNEGLTVPPKEKAKLDAIKKTLQEIEEKTESIDVTLPRDLSEGDFGNNLQNSNDIDLGNVQDIQDVKQELNQLEQKLEEASEDINKIQAFRDTVLEKAPKLQVELFRDLLNNTGYTQDLKQQLNQLEQKLEQALQDINQLQAFRDSVLEKALELEIELFSDLLTKEIELLQEFNQRIENGFSKIYDETLMVFNDLQKFNNAISGSDPNPSNLDVVGDLSLDYDQGTYDFALSYHFGAQAVPYNPESNSSATFPLVWFEPIAGVRLNDFYTGIDANISYNYEGESLSANGNFQESFVEKRTWLEPMVGAKMGLQVSPPITLWLRGDVSGFGLAGDTNLAWNFISGMDWWVSPRTSLLLAYRFYEFSYGNGSGSKENLLDINFNGPLIGVTYNF